MTNFPNVLPVRIVFRILNAKANTFGAEIIARLGQYIIITFTVYILTVRIKIHGLQQHVMRHKIFLEIDEVKENFDRKPILFIIF